MITRRAILSRLFLVASAFLFECAVAACLPGECLQDTSSSGRINITVAPKERVRIWGLQNIELTASQSPQKKEMTSCAYSSSGRARLSMSSSHGMSLQDQHGHKIPFELAVKVTDPDSSWQILSPGHPLNLAHLGGNPANACDGQSNVRFQVRLTKGSANYPPGYYSDVITLTLAPF